MPGKNYTKLMKKEVTNQWHELLPCMEIEGNMSLMNILGPIVVGILLEIGSNKNMYYPTLYIHNLANNIGFVSTSLNITDNFNYVTTVSKPDKYMKIAEALKNKAIVPIEGDIHINELLDRLKEAYSNLYHSDKICIIETVLYLAGWSGNESIIKESVVFANEKIKQLSTLTEEDKDKVFSKIFEEIKEPEKIRKTVEEQIIELKLDKLPRRSILL
ncbi:hypothetical protein [Terrisporobacter vanillatitrophus]|uniref:hypothetical protein n=1 Tax=Terrisporobacter vanillatitrophus TaxID=3058402 RepID=UPI003369574A